MAKNITNPQKRIVHVAPIPDNPYSGIRTVVLLTVKELQNRDDVQVTLINSLATNATDIDGMKILPGSALRKVSWELRSSPKPGIVVIHGVFHWQQIFSALLCRMLNIPYVLVSHGGLSRVAQQRVADKALINWRGWIRQRVINSAQNIQFVSQTERDASIAPNHPGTLLSSTPILVPAIAEAVDHSLNSASFLFLGRKSVEVKGIDLLLESVKVNAQQLRDNNVHLSIVGPAEDNGQHSVPELIRVHGIEDLVCDLPGVAGAAKAEAFSSADVFLLTSRNEGEPVAVLEAMSYGLPVLVTRGTNMYDVVRENDLGWTCETDAESIGKGLVTALENKADWKAKGERARQWVTEHRSASAVISDQLLQYFPNHRDITQ